MILVERNKGLVGVGVEGEGVDETYVGTAWTEVRRRHVRLAMVNCILRNMYEEVV